MYLRINFKNVLAVSIALIFGYIALVIWTADEAFPEIEIEMRDIMSYAIMAASVGGNAVRLVNEERKLGIVKKGRTAEGADELLTKADLVSNSVMLDVLKKFPGLQVITEEKDSTLSESEAEKYQSDNYRVGSDITGLVQNLPSRKLKLSALTVWIDPLDATQEFTEGLLEYVTVMVCVVENGQPVFGVITRPFANETWFGLENYGIINEKREKWDPEILQAPSKRIVISRSHAGTVQNATAKAFGDEYIVEPAGGAGYKTLRLLNGTAALYLHTTYIKKWDTCAGDALVRSVGGAMVDLNGATLDYSPSADIVNKNGILVAAKNPYTYFQRWRNASQKSR